MLLIDFSCSGQQFEGSKAAFKVPVITLEGLLLQTANVIISFILCTQKKKVTIVRDVIPLISEVFLMAELLPFIDLIVFIILNGLQNTDF